MHNPHKILRIAMLSCQPSTLHMMKSFSPIISYAMILIFFQACQSSGNQPASFSNQAGEVRLIILDPGHFHAALIQKTEYKQVNPEVFVYAPEGKDLQEYLARIDGYNQRPDQPTHWKETVYTGEDYLTKMLEGKKGNVLITAGNNLKKTQYIKAALENGMNVLADKPMAINKENFELLKTCFRIAEEQNVLLYDIMTERYEITTLLQKEIAQISGLFGQLETGTPENPAVTKESVHHFFKSVSGAPVIRPAWFFDVEQQGEGIVDVTTHLVDLVQWECFPEQILDYQKDIEMIAAHRWSTPILPAEFRKATGLKDYPEFLSKYLKDSILQVYSNGEITYRLKGVYAKISVIWNFEAPEGAGDTHYSVMRGSLSHAIIRQGAEQNYQPRLYVEPSENSDLSTLETNLRNNLSKLSAKYPGIDLAKTEKGFEVTIPDRYRIGHEGHFGQVAENFMKYLIDGKLPKWEVPNMIAKYYTTTKALEMAQ